jgi:hypothetical protein
VTDAPHTTLLTGKGSEEVARVTLSTDLFSGFNMDPGGFPARVSSHNLHVHAPDA